MSNKARPVTSLAPSRNYLRAALAKASNPGDPTAAERMINTRWPWADGVKALVGGIDSAATLPGKAQADFFDEVFQELIFGQVSGWRFVDPHQTMMRASTRGSAYWTAEHAQTPICKPALANSELARLKITALIVLTNEAVQASGENAERAIQRDIVAAAAELINSTLLDPTNSGTAGQIPAAITNGLSQTATTTSPADDILTLISNFDGDLSRAVFAGDPAMLTRLATARDAGGSFMFIDCGVRGGSILGVPAIATRGAPDSGVLALIDPGGIAVSLDDISLSYSNEATVNMVSAPGTDDSTPVDLFSADLMALKLTVSANWEVQIPGSVALLAGSTW